MMNKRERLLKVLRGEIPDCVPVTPDFSNMIPVKLTDRPFGDNYLYKHVSIYDAYCDCNLAELKRLYGSKIALKGNLHTTEVMLRGTPDDVIKASKQAIDDAGGGGRFILSTVDQCGRDTPVVNLRAMVHTARTYGKY
jgi:uroporphyrinogen-III decarboxylase